MYIECLEQYPAHSKHSLLVITVQAILQLPVGNPNPNSPLQLHINILKSSILHELVSVRYAGEEAFGRARKV